MVLLGTCDVIWGKRHLEFLFQKFKFRQTICYGHLTIWVQNLFLLLWVLRQNVCVCTTPKQAKQKYALYNNILRLSTAVARGRSETKSTCTLYETEICQASLKFCNFCRTVNKPKLKGLGKREVIPLIDKQITDEQSQVLKAQIINAWKWMLKWIRKKVVFNLNKKYFFRFNKNLFYNFHMNW